MKVFLMNFRTFFSKQASNPSGLFGRMVMTRIFDLGNAALNNFMKEMLALQANDSVLEIGFGTGKLINEMAKLAKDGLIEGIDLSSTMVAVAERKNKDYIAKGKVIIRQGDFEKASYKDDCFNKICSANTIYFWPNPDNIIKKVIRVLKPGGKLILAFEDKKQLENRQLSTHVFQFYSLDEIENLLQNNGFTGDIDILSREIRSKRYHCAVAVK
ncbi:MAG: class I SAM-dependent methyltransferase [bacterium]|nr:class I SAM-dependent methyltransferase [bacterium]